MTTTYLNVEVRRNGNTEYLWYWRWCAGFRIWVEAWGILVTGPNDLFQGCQRSHQVRLRVGGKIHLLCVFTVQHAQYVEIERGSGSSEENFQVAVVEGGRGSQRRLLQRLDVFKASGTETNLLGNQERRLLHLFQKGVWGGDEHRNIWSAPIPNSGLVRQRWQGNLELNSTVTVRRG